MCHGSYQKWSNFRERSTIQSQNAFMDFRFAGSRVFSLLNQMRFILDYRNIVKSRCTKDTLHERNKFLFTSATSRYKQQRKNCAKLRQLGFRCTRLIYSSRHKSPFWTKFTENVILWYFCATQCHKIDSFERQLASKECVLKSIYLNSHTFVTFSPQVWGNL